MQQIPKDPHEREYATVFESVDRLLERPLIEGAGAMDCEIPTFPQACSAEVTFSRRVRETAARTVRGEYGPDGLVTIRTDDQAFSLHREGGLTDRTDRRKEEVQEPREGTEAPHLKIPSH